MGPSRLLHSDDDQGHRTSQSFDTSNSRLQIVEIYSDCKITYATDKLMAIAGLAEDRRIRGEYPYRGSRYYLGMWEKSLLQDLLWTSRGPQRRKFLDQLRLPSWAWAAYEGSLTFLKPDEPHLKRVEYRRTILVAEVEVFELVGLSGSAQLPLQSTVTMSARLRLSEISPRG